MYTKDTTKDDLAQILYRFGDELREKLHALGSELEDPSFNEQSADAFIQNTTTNPFTRKRVEHLIRVFRERDLLTKKMIREGTFPTDFKYALTALLVATNKRDIKGTEGRPTRTIDDRIGSIEHVLRQQRMYEEQHAAVHAHYRGDSLPSRRYVALQPATPQQEVHTGEIQFAKIQPANGDLLPSRQSYWRPAIAIAVLSALSFGIYASVRGCEQDTFSSSLLPGLDDERDAHAK